MSKLRTKFKKIAIRILTISTALTTVLSPLGTTTIYAADKISDGTEWSYNYSGKTETFTVPVSGTYKLEIAGAQGGNYDVYKGGYGGSVAGNVFLNKGDTLKITVGSQAGYNGGGTGTLSNGGGATSIKVNNNTYAIAGGGGGAGLTNNGGNGGTTASKVDANNGENSAKSNSAGGGSGYKGGTAGYLIYHTHTGDSINGGGCYSKAISHTHDESKGCYTKCTAKLKCTGTTYDDDSNRRHVMYCGSGHGPFFPYDCQEGEQCGSRILNCSKTIDGYTVNCNKDETTIDSSYASYGGSNYYNESFITDYVSKEGTNKGNGYAKLSLAEASLAIVKNLGKSATTVETLNADFTICVNDQDNTSIYEWQFYNVAKSRWETIGTMTGKGSINYSDAITYNNTLINPSTIFSISSYSFDSTLTGSKLTLNKTEYSRDNGIKTRCIYTSSYIDKILTSDECTLTVIPLAFKSIEAIYMDKQVNIGDTIDIENVYVKAVYNNGDIALHNNFSGLTFDATDTNNTTYGILSGENTKITLKKLGKVSIKTTVTLGSTTYRPTFDIEVIDKKAPTIESIEYSDIEILGGKNDVISAVPVKVKIIATDNNAYDPLYYALIPSSESVNDSDYKTISEFDITISDNIKYTAYVKDYSGNITQKEISLVLRDTQEPEIVSKELLYPDTNKWYNSNTILIQAKDNITPTEELLYKFYLSSSSEDKENSEVVQDWSVFNALTTDKNGVYYVEVKDKVGNISVCTILVSNIDGIAPEITEQKPEFNEDGTALSLTVKVKDTISGLYQYSFDGIQYTDITTDTDTVNTEYTITKENVDYAAFKAGIEITIYVSDKAGNISSHTFRYDNSFISDEDLPAPTVTVARKTPMSEGYLRDAKYQISYEFEYGIADKPYGVAKWNGDAAPESPSYWSISPVYTATNSGTFRAFVKGANGGIGYTDFTVLDVDRDTPSIEWTVNDWDWSSKTATFQITVQDTDSGIDYILFNGASLLLNEKYAGPGITGENNVVLDETVTLYPNATYSVHAYDLAGNEGYYAVTCTENGEMVVNAVVVTFVDHDNSILDTQIILKGNNAKEPEKPYRKGYTFTGWDKSLVNITEDTMITAQYVEGEEDNRPTYKVTFTDYDGTFLGESKVKSGEDATPPSDPIRMGYIFKGWDKSYLDVTSNITCKAAYIKDESTENNIYTVTFMDYDGTFLGESEVKNGEDATPPSDPTRKGYTFKGWDKSYQNVTSDITCKAIYIKDESIENTTYTVTFVDYDGTFLGASQVNSGENATPPDSPTRKGYTFKGWDKSYQGVTSNITCKAVYTKDDKPIEEGVKNTTYTVTFVDYDGTFLKEDLLNSGENATPPKNPTRDGYTFKGWDKSYQNVKKDITVTAVYTSSKDDSTTAKEDNKTNTGTESTGSSTSTKSSSGTSSKGTSSSSTQQFEELENTEEVTDDGESIVPISDVVASDLPVDNGQYDEQTEEEEFRVEKEVYSIDTTFDSEEQEAPSQQKTAGFYLSIVFLLGLFGFTIFYYLNKKYMWMKLPAIALLDELPIFKK